jgi:hypothetical protein
VNRSLPGAPLLPGFGRTGERRTQPAQSVHNPLRLPCIAFHAENGHPCRCMLLSLRFRADSNTSLSARISITYGSRWCSNLFWPNQSHGGPSNACSHATNDKTLSLLATLKPKGTNSVVSHPCKERENGAPSFVVVQRKTKRWATRPGGSLRLPTI